jgi:hypothetical protein
VFSLPHTRVAPFAVLLLACGCAESDSGAVRGEVTCDGRPVARGMISFLPADGKGSPAAGEISAGRYAVADVAPGPKVVKVDTAPAVSFPRGREERAQTPPLPAPAPVGTLGNNARVEIHAGSQTLDFHLATPGRR